MLPHPYSGILIGHEHKKCSPLRMAKIGFGVEQLFGSKVRARLLRLFFENPKEKFFVRELERRIGSHIHAIRRELHNLESLGIIAAAEDTESREKKTKQSRRYYTVRAESELFPELQNLFLKFHIFIEQGFAKKAAAEGTIAYLALTGSFVGANDFPTDLVMVGSIDRTTARKLIRSFETELGRPVNYTLLTVKEFEERRRLTDRFLYGLLEQKKIVLIDTLFS